MIFSRLKVHGFKSFVDNGEFLIEPGLTGIVGPNGCGKSNLVEALRWVMGESSYKNMRASGMDDVIFSGSGNRPARNIAEVTLVIDNSDRTAPAAFNQSDLLEVTRRIERDSGSVYRVNGREVRARDVQLLFADASSGARSPAMVRQGQIGEIISAKPQQRRRILEEAAGVSGLYSRRHEAEMRLKGAEDNLLRLDDIIRQLQLQAEALTLQAKQASEYRTLSAELRRIEALLLLLAYREADAQAIKLRLNLTESKRAIEERQVVQVRAARDQALAAADLPHLREAEVRAGAALQRVVLARQDIESQEKQSKARREDLARQIVQIERDKARELALVKDAHDTLLGLKAQREALDTTHIPDQDEALKVDVVTAEAHSRAADETLAKVQGELARRQAEISVTQAGITDHRSRIIALTAELARHDAEVAALPRMDHARQIALTTAVEQSLAQRNALEATLAQDSEALLQFKQQEQQQRGPLSKAEQHAQRLDTEFRTLTKMLAVPTRAEGPTVLDEIQAEKGYEMALGAALGDDLEASLALNAPAHWALTEDKSTSSLPEGVLALSQFVTAPEALRRRLTQVGIVAAERGGSLRSQLLQGQRLVSLRGDLWRWDGFTLAANTPTPAALRLVEHNRLEDLRLAAEAARSAAQELHMRFSSVQTQIRQADMQEQKNRALLRDLTRTSESARDSLAAFERAQAQTEARRNALIDAQSRTIANLEETGTKLKLAEAALAEFSSLEGLYTQFEAAKYNAQQAREHTLTARSALNGFVQERNGKIRRLKELEREEASWQERQKGAADQAREFEFRLIAAQAEHDTLSKAPDHFEATRAALRDEMTKAEQALKAANDQRATGESRLNIADKTARLAQDAMSQAREELARLETRAENAETRLAELIRHIAETLQSAPEHLAELAGIAENDAPDLRSAERQMAQLKQARDRLGAVNLRAESELNDVTARSTHLLAEHADLTEAIRRLRLAIQSLNREGRQRLLGAFDQINAHFKDLFTTLFGGGAAELQLIESDDPLEAGLEILARPPGKKPQTMTLLSGGEQALTAMSLIFAIFLTNPSPICVLDEVDAPLDDSNVERFCDLLDDMSQRTQTRFLTITHNPITMARMNRLFGVTMAERGVSELVSVDLEMAERFVEAKN
jgi:chromosome segregation protein